MLLTVWFDNDNNRAISARPNRTGLTHLSQSEAGHAALKVYTDMFMGDPGVTAIGFMDDPQAAFKAGRAGMHIDASFCIGSLNGTQRLTRRAPNSPPTASACGPTVHPIGSTPSRPRPMGKVRRRRQIHGRHHLQRSDIDLAGYRR